MRPSRDRHRQTRSGRHAPRFQFARAMRPSRVIPKGMTGSVIIVSIRSYAMRPSRAEVVPWVTAEQVVSIRSYAMGPSRGHPQRSPWFCGSRGRSARRLMNAAGLHAVSSGRLARAQETRERWPARRGVLQRRVAPTHQLAPTGAGRPGATVDRRRGCRRLPLFRRCGGWDEQKAGVVTGPMVGARGRVSVVLASLRAER